MCDNAWSYPPMGLNELQSQMPCHNLAELRIAPNCELRIAAQFAKSRSTRYELVEWWKKWPPMAHSKYTAWCGYTHTHLWSSHCTCGPRNVFRNIVSDTPSRVRRAPSATPTMNTARPSRARSSFDLRKRTRRSQLAESITRICAGRAGMRRSKSALTLQVWW